MKFEDIPPELLESKPFEEFCRKLRKKIGTAQSFATVELSCCIHAGKLRRVETVEKISEMIQ